MTIDNTKKHKHKLKESRQSEMGPVRPNPIQNDYKNNERIAPLCIAAAISTSLLHKGANAFVSGHDISYFLVLHLPLHREHVSFSGCTPER